MFSNFKHPFLFKDPQKLKPTVARLNPQQSWALIQNLYTPVSIRRFVPSGRKNRPDLGLLMETWEGREIRMSGRKKISEGHMGKEQGCGEKKKIRRRLRGYNVQSFGNTVSILKRYKGGRIRDKNG